MWGVGCILASFLFRRIPFFKGRSDEDQLVKITQVLGSEEFIKYVEKYDLDRSLIHEYSSSNNNSNNSNDDSERERGKTRSNPLLHRPRKPWTNFVPPQTTPLSSSSSSNSNNDDELISSVSLDLLSRLLVFDHQNRLTAREAMLHPWFGNVRKFESMNDCKSCGIIVEEDLIPLVPNISNSGKRVGSNSISNPSSSSSSFSVTSVNIHDFLDAERFRLSEKKFVPLMDLVKNDDFES
jgi:casein kinase II subunit alpha